MPRVLDLSAKPGVKALQAALNLLAARHEVLRMHYKLQADGSIVGEVTPASQFTVPVTVTRTATKAAAEAALSGENAAQYNLATGPLVRARVLNHTFAEGATLVVTMHHAVGDAWSQNVFMADLSEAYAAVQAGRAPAWEALPIQYADFSVWQQDTLAGPQGAELRRWWRAVLAGAPTQLQLPVDRSRPADPTYEANTVRSYLPDGLLERLEATASRLRVNTQAVVLAALQAVLMLFSGQDDIVVGVPIAARDRPETQGLVGYFVQALPVRGRVGEDATFADMAVGASKAMMDTLDHAGLPFHHIVSATGVARSAASNPLFQVRGCCGSVWRSAGCLPVAWGACR